MPIVVECPSCGRQLKVPDDLIGQKVRCSDCAHTFPAEAVQAPAPSQVRDSAPSKPEREPERDDEFDDDREERRPSRRRKRRDYEPHRGGLILVLGIVGIVVGGVGLITGPMAWIMGGKDLKAIDAGTMDPEGRQLTQIGYILGIVATILNILGCLFGIAYIVFIIFFVTSMAKNMPRTVPGGMPPPPPRNPPPFKQMVSVAYPMRTADYLPPRAA